MPFGYFVEVEGPVDPGFGGGIGGMRPGNALPTPPVIPGNLPEMPPGVWPPLTPSVPIGPAHPIGGHPIPPGTIWPPVWVNAPRPGHDLPTPPARPGTPLPPTPGHPGGGPIPPSGETKPPSGTFWVVCGIPGVGWRYVCVDPSLEVGTPLPPAPAPK
jgi:hypothetical protein